MRAKSILCIVFASLVLPPLARGAVSDPLFVFTPAPPPPPAPLTPPPTGHIYGPCGLAVSSSSQIYVSDYYHHAIDVFTAGSPASPPGYVTQATNVDPLDGPCGLAIDPSGSLYVNDFHRSVLKLGAAPSFTPGPVFDTEHPTGVAIDATSNIYVDDRTYVAVYDPAGNPVLDEGDPLRIGEGTLGDGYGVAVSGYTGVPSTLGYVYVPDASTNTVKVYDPAGDKVNPVAEIKGPSGQPFVSLRDSAIAVDRVSGFVYVADNVQPEHTERPQATIYAYSPANVYKGHLKYNVIDALPPGLTVDNTANPSQGRVYVTSGNTTPASIYAYGPGAATLAAPLPPLGSGLAAPGSGSAADRGGPASDDANATSTSFAASASTVTQSDNLRVSVTGNLSPKKLPREGSAPISVTVGWEIATTDGSPPPKLKTLRIEINREGHFDYAGLPTCPYAKIQPATTQRALANCRSALVGRGSFSAEIALKGQEAESYATKGRLLVFNGEEKGKPVLFGQIYSAHPFATSFVIPFAVSKISKGAYGTALTATLPPALRSWGNLTGIEMKLSRKYRFEGKRRSYLSAGCPAPKGFGLASFRLARTAFSFTGGKELATTVVGNCRVRGRARAR